MKSLLFLLKKQLSPKTDKYEGLYNLGIFQQPVKMKVTKPKIYQGTFR